MSMSQNQPEMMELIEEALNFNSTSISRISSIIKDAPENKKNNEAQIKKETSLEIYKHLYNSPQGQDLETKLKKENQQLTFDFSNESIKNYINNPPKTIKNTSFFNSENLILETDHYIIQTIDKNPKGILPVKDNFDIQFLKKIDISHKDYNNLSKSEQSNYGIYNSQYLTQFPNNTISIKNLINNEKFELHLSHIPNLSINEKHQLAHTLSSIYNTNLENLNNDGYMFKGKIYKGIDNKSLKEYVVNPKIDFSFNCEDVLHNGISENRISGKTYSREYYQKNGYEIYNANDFYSTCQAWLNQNAGKWQEISEAKYEEMANTHPKPQQISEGFFLSSAYKGDLHLYYQKIDNRYFTSYQRYAYDQKYILENLKSHISRAEPLSKHIANLTEILKQYYPSIATKLAKTKTYSFQDTFLYEELEGNGFIINKRNTTTYNNNTEKETVKTQYKIDLNNQSANKIVKNKLDSFAVKYLTDIATDRKNGNIHNIKKTMEDIGFKGDIHSFALELISHKPNPLKIKDTIYLLINKNTSSYTISPPTLKSINTFAVSNNLIPEHYLDPAQKLNTNTLKQKLKL